MILALDLEYTLISSTMSCFVRPYLNDFIEWGVEIFDEILLFTTVLTERIIQIQNNLFVLNLSRRTRFNARTWLSYVQKYI